MNPTNLFQFYQSKGKALPSVQDRVKDPFFQQALTKAGISPEQYLGMGGNNEQANIKLLPFLSQAYGGANAPTNTPNPNPTGTPPVPTVPPTGQPTASGTSNAPTGPNFQPTGDPNLDASITTQQQTLSVQDQAYATLQTTLNSLQTGTLQLAPEEQQYLNAMQESAKRAEQITKQSTDAQTGVVKEGLARSGATQSSPEVAASQIALTVQAGANAILDIDSKANLAIAQFQQGIRDGRIKSARDSYASFEQYQKDRASTIENMYKDISDHEKQMRDYDLEKKKYSLEIAKFNHTLSVDEGQGIGQLTPAALDTLANGYLTSGVLPTFGNGKQSANMKAQVVNRAAELAGGNGNLNPAANAAIYKANSNALKQQTSNLTTAETAYNTFDKNGQFALTLATGLNRSNSPIVNQLTNKVIDQTTNLGQLDSFRAVITSLQAEYATLISIKGGSGGQVTEADKSKAEKAIPNDISPNRLKAVLNNLKTEGTNVLNSRRSTVDILNDSIKKASSAFTEQTNNNPLAASVISAHTAGYSSQEILNKLLLDPKYEGQIKSARDSGYTDDEIISYLINQK